MAADITDWLSRNYPEIAGAVLGLVYVYLSVRQKIQTWIFGIATSVIYAWVFYKARFYAGMGLQLYYVIISIYGWYFWLRGKRPVDSREVPVTAITTKYSIWGIFIFVLTFTLLYQLLRLKTDSPVPVMDALTTSLSIVATWLMARKILENWLIWIVTDLLCIGLYAFQQLWPTVLLFSVYETLAIYGYIQWKTKMQPLNEGK